MGVCNGAGVCSGCGEALKHGEYYGNELYRVNGEFAEMSVAYHRLIWAAKVACGFVPTPPTDKSPTDTLVRFLEAYELVEDTERTFRETGQLPILNMVDGGNNG
jgi:hypothetical protein